MKINEDSPYYASCKMISMISFVNGYLITFDQAYEIWSEISNVMAAGWLHLPDETEDLWNEIKSRVELIGTKIGG